MDRNNQILRLVEEQAPVGLENQEQLHDLIQSTDKSVALFVGQRENWQCISNVEVLIGKNEKICSYCHTLEQQQDISQSANKSVALFADRDTYSNEGKYELGESILEDTWNLRDAIWAHLLRNADISDDGLWKKLKK